MDKLVLAGRDHIPSSAPVGHAGSHLDSVQALPRPQVALDCLQRCIQRRQHQPIHPAVAAAAEVNAVLSKNKAHQTLHDCTKLLSTSLSSSHMCWLGVQPSWRHLFIMLCALNQQPSILDSPDHVWVPHVAQDGRLLQQLRHIVLQAGKEEFCPEKCPSQSCNEYMQQHKRSLVA
jgi:hypothetical protein